MPNIFDQLASEHKDVKPQAQKISNNVFDQLAQGQDESRGFLPSFQKGWKSGVTGLLSGGIPESAAQDESFIEHMGSLLGETLSDVPGMLVSGVAGEAVGGPIGAAAGAFAGPTLLKQSLAEYRDYASKGNDITFGEFLDRAGRVGTQTGKSAAIGAATGAVSKLLPVIKNIPGMDKLLSTKYGTPIATGALELGTMTGSKAALEGRLPDKQEVVDNALGLMGFKLASKGGQPIARGVGSVLEKGTSLGRSLLEKAPESISKPFKEFQEHRAKQKQFWNMLEEHIGERNAKLVESQFKWRDAMSESAKQGKFSKQDLNDMMYYRQKTGNPKIEGDTYDSLVKRLNPNARRFVDTVIDQHLKDSLKAWNDNPTTKDISPREGLEEIYLPGLYEYEPGKFEHAYNEVSKRFKTRNPFSNEKVFLNYLDAFKEAGLKPRYDNIVDLMKAYDATMIKSTVNSELISKIKDLEKRSGEKLIVRSTDKQYADAKRNGFVQFDDPFLRRYVASTDANGKPVWATTAVPVLVHPDFAPVFQGVFTKESYKKPNMALRAYDALGNALRTVHVRYSPFHYGALLEHGASTIGTRKSFGYLFKGWSKDIDKLRNDKNFMEDAARSGLVIHKPVEDIKSGGHLFSDYHPRLKLASWKQFVDKEIGRLSEEGKPPSQDEIVAIKKDMAGLVNNIFGGQNWELQHWFNDPKNLLLARRLIGYPDWTVSAIKNAANTFSPGVKGDVARKTWMRYGINYMMFQGAMKFLMSGWQNKDPKDPDSGIEFNPQKALDGLDKAKQDPTAWYKFPLPDINVNIAGHVFNPGRDAEDRRLYAHTGKQAIEIGNWAKHTFNEFFSKSNPLIQLIWKQVMESTPYEEGTFPVQASKESKWQPWGGSKPWTKERFLSRFKELGGSVLPFGVQGLTERGIAPYLATAGGVVPISKGMGLMKSEQYIESALRSKDNESLNNIRRILKDNGYKTKDIDRKISTIRNKLKKE
jgi:hypothetical protein